MREAPRRRPTSAAADALRKLVVQPDPFPVAIVGLRVVGTVVAGFDGHRCWVYDVAVKNSSRDEHSGRRANRRRLDLLAVASGTPRTVAWNRKMSLHPHMTVAELAELVGGAVLGDGTKSIRGVATLTEAGPHDLSWVGDATPDRLAQAAASSAGALLYPGDRKPIENRTLITLPDPDVALCDVLAALAPPANAVPIGVHATAEISPGAVVEGAAIGANVLVGAGAVVGSGTQLHPGVYVGPGTTIGRDCVLWPQVVIRERVTLGDRVIIHPHATIGADGFGYLLRDGRHVKIPQIGTVVIEDDVEIGAGTAVDRARSGITRIGRGTKIDNLTQIGHNVTIGEHCIIIAQCAIAGSVTIGNYVVMGGQSGVADNRTIGDGAQIAAKSTAMGNVPAGQVVRGNPAVPHSQFLRQQVTVRKLPKWMDHLRALTVRVEKLERSADDTPGCPAP